MDVAKNNKQRKMIEYSTMMKSHDEQHQERNYDFYIDFNRSNIEERNIKDGRKDLRKSI